MDKDKKLIQELLIVIDKDNASALYSISNSSKGFNDYLMSENTLKIQKNKIYHNNNAFEFSAKLGKVKNKNQKFFYLVFRATLEEIDKFREMLREFKKVINQENVIIETLRDDISLYYSQKGYSLIYSIENSMRKFITYFMITNVGKDWVNDSPENIKDTLNKSKRKQYMDVLHQLDFIHLGDFLFKKYQSSSAEQSLKCISEYKSIDEVSLNEIQDAIPRSNWDKYFKNIVNKTDEYLKTRWKTLYEFRNKIAHTSSVSEYDIKEIEINVKEIESLLDDAFKKIDVVDLEESDRQLLSERIAKNIDEKMEFFFNELNGLEAEIRSLDKNKSNLPLVDLVKKLKIEEVLDVDTASKIEELLKAKSKIVFDGSSSSNQISELNQETEVLRNKLRSKWIRDVYSALERLGGTGSLDEIYKSVREVSSRNFPDSWETSVRKTIYTHSSDTDIFNGVSDLFEKSGRGKWMIRKSALNQDPNAHLGDESEQN